MTLRLENVTFDCHDALLVGRFWSAALGRPLHSNPEPSENFASIGMGKDGQESWLFAHVPEPKTSKTRVHVDLVAAGDPEAEITRLVDLGAKRVADKDEWGFSWTIMTDPKGNEFCVSRMTA